MTGPAYHYERMRTYNFPQRRVTNKGPKQVWRSEYGGGRGGACEQQAAKRVHRAGYVGNARRCRMLFRCRKSIHRVPTTDVMNMHTLPITPAARPPLHHVMCPRPALVASRLVQQVRPEPGAAAIARHYWGRGSCTGLALRGV